MTQRQPTEMELRVATALWDRAMAYNKRMHLCPQGKLADQSPSIIAGMVDEARAAIRAMKEPTDDVLLAGYNVHFEAPWPKEWQLQAFEELSGAKEIYQAMISAASPEDK